ncbi:unnamed protein product [Bursaphelenchus xylophilus]|uniref:(pine wood nematode) hypothetical protein n=1 Tax=Bursaphelenchus xylophilus TaxID=6326 RepID=A0A1I7RKM1_BURXY|nr:unnamed protein product [Bursaphelenchus xylophilus]CAG9131230.1 unnamed protein product [Bursaphelenchus xylophilus]
MRRWGREGQSDATSVTEKKSFFRRLMGSRRSPGEDAKTARSPRTPSRRKKGKKDKTVTEEEAISSGVKTKEISSIQTDPENGPTVFVSVNTTMRPFVEPLNRSKKALRENVKSPNPKSSSSVHTAGSSNSKTPNSRSTTSNAISGKSSKSLRSAKEMSTKKERKKFEGKRK